MAITVAPVSAKGGWKLEPGRSKRSTVQRLLYHIIRDKTMSSTLPIPSSTSTVGAALTKSESPNRSYCLGFCESRHLWIRDSADRLQRSECSAQSRALRGAVGAGLGAVRAASACPDDKDPRAEEMTRWEPL